MSKNSAAYLSELHKSIDSYFGLEEVRTLCFELGVDYDNLRGETKQARIRELIVALARGGRLQALVDLVRRQRPHVDWQDVPPDFALPASVAQEDIREVVQYTVYGDVVHGNKVGGDQISMGDISGSSGIAVGAGASASVQTDSSARVAPVPHGATPAVQEAIAQLNRYLQLVSEARRAQADELAASVEIVLAAATAVPFNPLQLKLLTLGQRRLAAGLADDVPGLEQVVERFVTAVAHEAS